ncbi:MAG: aminotransferase class I/II-fold pyridoxal phosphate-dependent enzyme, partial [Deltaproteobacteria bacterium]|nr:aminotransferase class I/II-fold pyridoxal phosphate-dependent enzyme [Deltaproteobacteria bacterium]
PGETNDAGIQTVLLDDEFQIDVPSTLKALSSATKIIFCCSPNNPTGNLLGTDEILRLCRESGAIVVVDEAYVDFAQVHSLCSIVGDYPNLVILRTLSKAWGLAGIRLGYTIAHPEIVHYLMKIKSPYNINALTSSFALKALDQWESVERTISLVIQERGRLQAELSSLPQVQKVYPSKANFILARFTDGRQTYEKLAEKGIIVRYRGNEPKLENCLRITVGTPEENSLLLSTLEKMA